MSDLKMPDLNSISIIGRLTRDPELRYIQSGAAICKLSLAVSRKYKTKSGEQKEDTFFVNVEVWNKAGEWIGANATKGRPVMVEGALKGNEWDDKATGQKRSSLEIRAHRVQILDWDDRAGSQKRETQRPATAQEPTPDDNIPF